MVASHDRLHEIPEAERFDPGRLVRELTAKGKWARFEPDVERIVALVGAEARTGDVVLIFSNGSFNGLHEKLLERLDVAEAR